MSSQFKQIEDIYVLQYTDSKSSIDPDSDPDPTNDITISDDNISNESIDIDDSFHRTSRCELLTNRIRENCGCIMLIFFVIVFIVAIILIILNGYTNIIHY
jgi:hypothetical protein